MRKIVLGDGGDWELTAYELKLYLDKKGIKYLIDDWQGMINEFVKEHHRQPTYEEKLKYDLVIIDVLDDNDIKPIERDDPVIVQLVEEGLVKGKIIEIPEDVEWELESCEGEEWISEKHRTWGRNDEK